MIEDVETTPEDRGDDVVDAAVTPVAPDAVVETAPVTDKLDGELETPEEKAEREKEEAEAAAELKAKNARIPKHRVDEMRAKDAANARAREEALVKEINQLKAGRQIAETQESVKGHRAKIEELTDKYEAALADGKIDEAKAFRKQIEPLRDELFEVQTNAKANAARSATIEELTFNNSLAVVEKDYPLLNPDHIDGDPTKIEEVADMMKAFIATGMSRVAALTKAVGYVVGAPKSAAPTAPADKRAEEARRRAADADKRQPASIGNIGANSDKHGTGDPVVADVVRMTQKQFDGVSDETKARLRGDIL